MNIKDIKTEWDLSLLLSDEGESVIEKSHNRVAKAVKIFADKWNTRDDYTQETHVLKEALDDYEKLRHSWGENWHDDFYFWLRSTKDQSNSQIKARFNKALDFAKEIHNTLLFFELKLGKIEPKKQKVFLTSNELAPYKHFLERIFNESAFMLSEVEEKMLTLVRGTAYSDWVRMLSDLLSRQERGIKDSNTNKTNLKTFAQLQSLISDTNKTIRDQAAIALNDILSGHVAVAEAEINAVLEYKKTVDTLRTMPRPDTSRHLGDDIESDVVDALTKAVSDRFDIAQKYYALKTALMGQKQLAYHERNVPYGTVEKEYLFPEGVALVHKTFSSINKQFGDIFEMFVTKGHVDAYPQKGKQHGAFCAYNFLQEPTYILANYTNKLQDVLTIAHEAGHGINFELVKEKQNALYFGTPMSTAEVASTFFEDFVLEELAKKTTDEERLAIMMNKLNDDVSTIFRQVACYLFEAELHKIFRKEGYLSQEKIGLLFQKHMAAYMGDGVEQSAGSENWWVFWGHIRQYFYVYSYASGLLISKAMQGMVREDNDAVAKIKEFLSAGLSDSPKNIFKKLGIDISDAQFWHKGIDQIETLLKQTKELAKKLGKI